MPYAFLADAVVAVHLAFIGFVAVGGFVAWRRPLVLVAHLPAVGWALGIVTVGWPCPLTGVENHLRVLAGTQAYEGGFVDRYLTGILYPPQHERSMQALVAVAVTVAYVGLALRTRRARRRRAVAR
jgi:Protein of Unknown function (DUF2784)